MKNTGILLIGHGSAMPFNTMVFNDIKEKIEEKCGIPAEMGYIKLSKPSIEDAIAKLNKEKILAQPLMLCEGVYTKEKIPKRLAENVKLLNTISDNDLMCDVINSKIEKALKKSKLDDVSTEILLITHGSKLEYNKKFLKSISSKLNSIYPVKYAFMKYDEPTVQEVFGEIESERVVVLPLFVTDGIHTITDIPIILGLVDPPEPCPFMKNGKHHPDHVGMHNDDPNHRPQHHDLKIIEYDGEVLLGDSLGDDDRLVDLWVENILDNLKC